jgi:hypothetical protein
MSLGVDAEKYGNSYHAGRVTMKHHRKQTEVRVFEIPFGLSPRVYVKE